MSLYRGASAAAMTLVLAGCGGGGDGRARTIEGAEASASSVGGASAAPVEVDGDGDKTLTEAELNAALLIVTDLPTGYKQGTPDVDDDDDTAGDTDECSAKFKKLGDAEDTEAASAEASFEGGGLGTILEQGLESYEDEDTVEGRFDDVLEVLNECKTFTDIDDAGVKTDFTVGPLSFPKLGDDTVALAVTGKTPDFQIALNIVIVRLGRNVMSVAQGGLATDTAALEQASRKGFEKLAAATE